MEKKHIWMIAVGVAVIVLVALFALAGRQPKQSPQTVAEPAKVTVPQDAPRTLVNPTEVAANQTAPVADNGNATPAKKFYEMKGDASHVVMYDVGAGKYQYVINTLNSFDTSVPSPAATCSAEYGVTKITVSGTDVTVYINGSYTINAKVNDLFHALDYGTKDSMKGGHFIGVLKTACP